MAFQRVIYVLKAIGIDGILRTIQYALYRDKADKQFSRKTIKSEALTPGKLTETIPIQGGFRLEYEYARAELVFLKPNLVRVSWEPGVPPVPYTIAKVDWDIVETKLEQTPDRTTISSENICIMLDTRGGIDFEDNAGHLLRRDSVPERDGDEWRLSTRLAHGEHLYGLGERDGALNLRPGRYTCWNSDPGGQHSHGSDLLYINTPILLSLSEAGCHVVYFENSYRSTFNIDKESQVTFPGGMLRYYVIFGSLEQVYRDLAELTGRPFLPPKWALGYHQSRWSYSSEEEVRKVVAGFEEHRLPISAIHLDIDYMDGFRVFTSNRRRFPDLKRLTHDLDEKGIKVVTILDPSVKRDPEYKVFTEGSKRDVFCKLPNGKTLSGVSWPGWCAFPDFTKAAARSWWKAQYPALLDQGIAGIWHDMNEPASFAAWGDKSLPQSTVHSMEEHGGSHAEAHNLYGMLMDQAGYEALSQYTSAKRPWILSRAGWAGSQRYAWNWSGDVETSWEGLRQTIPTLLGLGLSGHVFTGVDIGGFSGSPTAKLYRRWFQFATFLPFFRTHSAIGTQPRQPWVYGEPTTSILRKFLELRFQLLPYLYTLAWKASQDGLPIVRPVFWENPLDKSLSDIEDEFLLGDALLVAPILDQDEKLRRVVLPQGTWYSYWDGQALIGPATIAIPVVDETIPIFIKGGVLLPMEVNGQLTLHLYFDRSKTNASQIYSDSGDGYGDSRIDTFQVLPGQHSLQMIWSKSGEYSFHYPEVKISVHGFRLKRVNADQTERLIQDNSVILPMFRTAELFWDGA